MIKVLEKAFDILEYMSCDGTRDYTLTELAAVTGDAVSTTSNILKTLCLREYLAHGVTRGTYRLGRMAQGITPYAGLDERLRQAAEAPMQSLVDALNASGVLSAIRAREKHVIARYRSDSFIEVNMKIVESGSLFSTSTGLVLLASMDDFGESIPDAHKNASAVFDNWESYRRIQSAVRENGFYYGYLKPGIAEAAAPIRMNGTVVAAVGVFFPKIYEQSMNCHQTVPALLQTAEAVENNLEVSV